MDPTKIQEYILAHCEKSWIGITMIASWRCEAYAYDIVGSKPEDYAAVHTFKAEVVKQATKLGVWVIN